MPKYILTKKAVKDLTGIWNYTFDTWSEIQADKYYEQIIKHCSVLSNTPDVGRKFNNILKGLRGSKINKHIVFYRKISEEIIEIERVLHERMDLISRLKE